MIKTTTTFVANGWQQNNTIIPSDLGNAFTPRQAGKKKSHIVFVLDYSASMQDCREATISGFNEYLLNTKNSAKEDGIKTFVSLYTFDGNRVNCVYSRKNVNKVQPLTYETYNPKGMTNLYDGIGGVMMTINEMLAEKSKDSIIINVLTDGMENASRTFNHVSIKKMISKAEEANWGFTFMGANIDAFAAGSHMGFSSHNTIQFNTSNIQSTMQAASRKSVDMKRAYASGMDTTMAYATTEFTDSERLSSVGGSNDK